MDPPPPLFLVKTQKIPQYEEEKCHRLPQILVVRPRVPIRVPFLLVTHLRRCRRPKTSL